MQHNVVWKPWHTPGVENLRLDSDSNGINASSHLLALMPAVICCRTSKAIAWPPPTYSIATHVGAFAGCG